MKILTASNVCAYITSQPAIKHFRLVDSAGNSVHAWNNQPAGKAKHVKDLKEVLSSDVIPDGIYFLQWKSNTRSEPKSIQVNKGRVNTDATTPAPRPLSDSVRSFDEALSDKTRIKQLELENENLRKQIDAMKEAAEAAADLEDDDLQEGAPVSDTVMLLKEIGLPLLEKFFELKEREVNALSAKATATQTAVRQPSAATTRPVAVQRPPIVPSANQPQPAPPVQIITGGGTAPSQEDDADLQNLVLFIQETDAEKLADWFQQLKNTEDALTVHTVQRLIREHRHDGEMIIS